MATKTLEPALRIALVGPSPDGTPGGMATVLREIAGSAVLREDGVVVTEAWTHEEGTPVRKLARALGAAVRLATAPRGSVAHVHMASGWSVRRKAAIVAVARARRLPVVLHLHGADLVEDIGDGGRLHRATFRRAARAASRVVVLSEYWAEWIARIEPRARAVVVRNAVALPPAVAPLAPEPTVLFLGRLGERKGIWTLLDCMDEVVAAVPDVRFVLAGDGDVDGVRARLDARPGHAARTEVLGWVPPAAVGSLIDRCWVLALPSRNEGLPMSVLETMARGRPVVATRVGGIPDAVRDGTDGSLIEPDDAAALAARLADLLSDRARCTAMGAAARERIRDRYDLDEAHRTMASIYREVAR